jgi:hypothetical protein
MKSHETSTGMLFLVKVTRGESTAKNKEIARTSVIPVQNLFSNSAAECINIVSYNINKTIRPNARRRTPVNIGASLIL